MKPSATKNTDIGTNIALNGKQIHPNLKESWTFFYQFVAIVVDFDVQ